MNEEDGRIGVLVVTSCADHVWYPQLVVAETEPEIIYTRFTDIAEFFRFSEDYNNIKNLITDIDGLYENGFLSLNEYKRHLENQWIRETDGFIQQRGPELVFPEVCSTIDDVKEDYLNIPQIEWPHDSFERVAIPSSGFVDYA